jgi:hypothetical protein
LIILENWPLMQSIPDALETDQEKKKKQEKKRKKKHD